MLVAVVVCALRDHKLINEATQGLLFKRVWTLGAVVTSLVALVVDLCKRVNKQTTQQAYAVLIASCRTRAECDEYHAYVIVVPVCCLLKAYDKRISTDHRLFNATQCLRRGA